MTRNEIIEQVNDLLEEEFEIGKKSSKSRRVNLLLRPL